MKNYGTGSLGEFLGDLVLYRNLQPCDPRLPRPLDPGLLAGISAIPRKTEPEYASIVVGIIEAARRLDMPGARLRSLVFLGDTRLNDGMAFQNLCRAGGWNGLAFIGSENRIAESTGAGKIERVESGNDLPIYLADRWGALIGIEDFCEETGLPVDESLAVVLDLDKTALGARGRNAATIDNARVEAVRITVADLLGDDFDDRTFREVYDTLNQPEFHPFTRDNQDYLAYISLILGSGLFRLDNLVADIRSGRVGEFEAFIEEVDRRSEGLPAGLKGIHQEILSLVQAGDPTPFKAFRRNEFRQTVRRMGHLPADTPVDVLLAEEILITAEVRSAALRLAGRGALIFGLSDKPDEASFPTPDLAAEGYQPIHRTSTHIVGG